MDRIRSAVEDLTRIFRAFPDKRTAHERCRSILAQLGGDRGFLSEVLRRHVSRPDVLNTTNYPVVAMEIETNPYFVLVANAWIPLPDARTDLSTKAIHHHGSMLLSTVNAFGPGYEHWLFSPPEPADGGLFRMKTVEIRRHAPREVLFVDARVPHLPVYPSSLTVTLALWSSEHPVSWKDRVKRIKILKQNERRLRTLARRLRLTGALELKVVEDFDFFPTATGFKKIAERLEFDRGPNADYLHSLFHVIQQTGNDALAPIIEEQSARDRATVGTLLSALKSGRQIEGRLSEGHFTVPYANFTTDDIRRTLAAQR
jgi:hypothetical protein